MRLYRIESEVAENLDYSLTGELPDPLSLFIDDGVMVPVEPCEHGRYDGHWPGVACRCYTDKRGRFGTMHNRKGWGEYIANEWIPCTHEPWCEGAGLGHE